MKMRSLFFVKAVQFTYPEPSSFILLSHVGYWKISVVPDWKKKELIFMKSPMRQTVVYQKPC